VENMVYFKRASKFDFTANHILRTFIVDILQQHVAPTYLYLSPDARPGAGLRKRVNVWGALP